MEEAEREGWEGDKRRKVGVRIAREGGRGREGGIGGRGEKRKKVSVRISIGRGSRKGGRD